MTAALAFAWIRDNPNTAVAIGVFLGGVVAAMVRYGLLRHREFVLFKEHMAREEREVWPNNLLAIKALGEQLDDTRQSMTKQVAGVREEMFRLFSEHGERIARVEAKLPNGEIKLIKEHLSTLVSILQQQQEGGK